MKVALVVPPNPTALEDAIDPHLGLLHLAAVVREAGHEVAYVETAKGDELPLADVYGITSYTINHHLAMELAQQARELTKGQAKVVWGGPLATTHKELPRPDLLKCWEDFEAIVMGTGEKAFSYYLQNLLDKPSSSPVPPVWTGAYQIRGEYTDFTDGTSPPPAYDLVDPSRYTRRILGRRAFGLMTSRGCPFSCSFCANDRQWGPWRKQPTAAALRDLRAARAATGLDAVIFWDNNFELRVNDELLAGIAAEGVTFEYYQRGKPHQWDQALYDAGGRLAFVGVETGSNELLRKMHKGLTTTQIRQAVENIQAVGIKVRIGLMFGFPGETTTTLAETRTFVESLPPDQVFLSFFAPFPGTEVWRDPGAFGVTWMAPWQEMALQNAEGYTEAPLETEWMSRADWNMLAREMRDWWRGLPQKGEGM